MNEPGITGPRPPAGGAEAGPRSSLMVKMRVGLAIEGNGPGAIHGLQSLLDLETGGCSP